MVKERDLYFDLLNRAEWIEKRQVIIKRDNRQCTMCGSKVDLCVHHTYYLKNYPFPWIYPNDSLITLCDGCHYKFHTEHEIPILDKHPSQIGGHKKKLRSSREKIIRYKTLEQKVDILNKLRLLSPRERGRIKLLYIPPKDKSH